MTTHIPLARPRIQPLPLTELASLLRSAASAAPRARLLALPVRLAPGPTPPVATVADSLVSLVRETVRSYEELDRKARRTFGPQHSLLSVLPALHTHDGLGEVFHDAANVRALQDFALVLTRISMLSSGSPDVDTVYLWGTSNLGAVRLYREPVSDPAPPEVADSTVPVAAFEQYLVEIDAGIVDGVPELYLSLDYRTNWLPSAPPVLIKLCCLGPDPGNVSSSWTSSDILSRRDSRKIGNLFTSTPMPPADGHVKTTLKIGSKTYEIWLRTDPHAAVPEIAVGKKPRSVTVPTSEPTPGIHDRLLAPAASGTQELVQGLENFLRNVAGKFRSSPIRTSTALHTGSAIMADVTAKLASPSHG